MYIFYHQALFLCNSMRPKTWDKLSVNIDNIKSIAEFLQIIQISFFAITTVFFNQSECRCLRKKRSQFSELSYKIGQVVVPYPTFINLTIKLS